MDSRYLIYTYGITFMKNIFNLRVLVITSLLAIPLIVSAQAGGDITGGITKLGGLADTITQKVLGSLVTLFGTAAMAVFFYGVVMYILGAREGDKTKIENGNKFLRWGLVALFVMFSVWGIITYVQDIFGIRKENQITIPQVIFGRGNTPSAPAPITANGSLPNAPTSQSACNPGSGCTTSTGGVGVCDNSRICQFEGQTSQTSISAPCNGKNNGDACIVSGGSGRAGTCDMNEESGVFGCYANVNTLKSSGQPCTDFTAGECKSGVCNGDNTCQ